MQNYQNVNLKTLDELPVKYRSLFSSYPSFNSIQSEVLDNVMKTNNSIVVAAPTGSGKTGVLELAIVKLLMDVENCGSKYDFKMVYVCPVKALCRERFNDWNPRFNRVGISCIEITGDGGDYFDLQGHNLIITTPEKWDSLTRKWRDNAGLVRLIKLFMIDEVHLLNDNKRGPVLEAIVCRMKTISKTLNIECVRFFAVSATIYNVEDLATWLGNNDLPAFCYKFGSEARPVFLEKIVKGYSSSEKEASFKFDIWLSYKVKPLILEYSKGKPTLIFCSSRKSVLMTANVLSQELTFHFSEIQKKNLTQGVSSLTDSKLKELILCGVGYHHAGLVTEDRNVVQNLFVAGYLPILVATSTLAMGVNLPAHSVIIKSTKQFIGGKSIEYPESSILQMIGRAGRPQFDKSAIAIIMTEDKNIAKYERLLESKEVVESSLHLHLPEYLNSEIVLYTITDISVAMEWIRCTYLYVRALKNPRHYGFDANATPSKIEKSLETFCEKEINGLKKAGLIELKNGVDISPTADGRLMSYFYLSFETFKIFLETKENETIPGILTALSEAHEFSEITLRMNERKYLNDLNKNKNRETIRFPLKGRIKTRSMKINVLIQASLGCLPIQDPSLNQESYRIVRIAERLAKCLSEYLSKKNFYESFLNSLILAKCLHAKLWENSPFVCRQLERIGPTLCSLLSSCGKTSFEAIKESNPRDLERILNRAPPFGNVLQDAVRRLPKYDLKLEKIGNKINVTISLTNPDAIRDKSTAGDKHRLTLIVGDSDNNFLCSYKISDQTLCQKDWTSCMFLKGLPHEIKADLISETWVGIDVSQSIEIVPLKKEEVDEKSEKPKRKRKSTAQPTKTPKKPKELKFLEEYAYKPKEKKKLKPVKKNAFVPCFDVDIDLPEEDEPEIFGDLSVNFVHQDRSLMQFEESLNVTTEMESEKKSPGGEKSDLITLEDFPLSDFEEEAIFNLPELNEEMVNVGNRTFEKPETDEFPKFNELSSVKPREKNSSFVPDFEVNIDISEMDIEEEIQNSRNLPRNFVEKSKSSMQFKECSNFIKDVDTEKELSVQKNLDFLSSFAPQKFINSISSCMSFVKSPNLTKRFESGKKLALQERSNAINPCVTSRNFVTQNRSFLEFKGNLNSPRNNESEKRFPVEETSGFIRPRCVTPNNVVDRNENLNSTPKVGLENKSPARKKTSVTSLQNIYEFLKNTPRSSISNQGN